MKKVFALLLAACMIVGLLAGCGSTAAESTAADVSSAAETASEAAAASAEAAEAPAEEPAQEPEAAEAPASAEEAAEPEEAEAPAAAEGFQPEDYGELELPLCEETESLSIFTRTPAMRQVPDAITSFGEFTCMQKAEELTNVHIEWQEVSNEAYTTQLNLIATSGDYPDMMAVGQLSGGTAKAYEDGIIIDLSDLIEEYAPDYYAISRSDDSIVKSVVNDEGLELSFYGMWDEPNIMTGMGIRQDWLDELGLEVPETLGELEDVLTAFKDAYDCSSPMLLSNMGMMDETSNFVCAFGVSGWNVAEQNTTCMYQEDGTVHCSLIEDGYRDYLTLMNDWYNKGLISKDFASISSDVFAGETDALINTDQAGFFRISVNQIAQLKTTAENPNFALTAMANVGEDGIVTNHFSDAALCSSEQSMNITTACENPELACQWMDFWYTNAGMMLQNYGVYEEVYTINDAGEIEFTDLINDNPWGVDATGALTVYSFAGNLFGRQIARRTEMFQTEDQKEARNVWSSTTDAAERIPTGMSLTTDESTEFGTLMGDIYTYAAECIMQFINGDRSLDEWDEYVASLKTMGIDDAIACYQAAMDRYNSK